MVKNSTKIPLGFASTDNKCNPPLTRFNVQTAYKIAFFFGQEVVQVTRLKWIDKLPNSNVKYVWSQLRFQVRMKANSCLSFFFFFIIMSVT